jgi:hypothetical protein
VAGLIDRFGREDGERVASTIAPERGPASLADLLAALERGGVEEGVWGEVVDACEGAPARFRAGRVDLLRATPEVLGSLPGLDQAAAERIVATRGTLDAERRRSPMWLLSDSVVSREQFGRLVDVVSCRSLQWRVRIEAGIEAPGDSQARAGDLAELPLEGRVVLEAVLDVAGTRPRVAWLRDVTYETAAAMTAAAAVESEPDPVIAAEPTVDPAPSALPSPPPRSDDESARKSASAKAPPAPPVDPRLGRWRPGR